jgi:hypothetical protein
MQPCTFDEIPVKIKPIIQRQNTNMKNYFLLFGFWPQGHRTEI